jgi:hypothetical protein
MDTITPSNPVHARAPGCAVMALVLTPWLPFTLLVYQISIGIYEGGEQVFVPMVLSIVLSLLCSLPFLLLRLWRPIPLLVLVGVWAPLLALLAFSLITAVAVGVLSLVI